MNALKYADPAIQPQVFHITADEHLDYRSIHSFKNVCPRKLDTPAHVVIDMAHTRYVDSSGVALLHCLRHWVKAPLVTVQVVNCEPGMRRVLCTGRLAHHIQFD